MISARQDALDDDGACLESNRRTTDMALVAGPGKMTTLQTAPFTPVPLSIRSLSSSGLGSTRRTGERDRGSSSMMWRQGTGMREVSGLTFLSAHALNTPTRTLTSMRADQGHTPQLRDTPPPHHSVPTTPSTSLTPPRTAPAKPGCLVHSS